jgi:hypothetical protein
MSRSYTSSPQSAFMACSGTALAFFISLFQATYSRLMASDWNIYVLIYLFVAYLVALFQWLRLFNVEWSDGKWTVNWKGLGRKRSWTNLRYYPGISLEGLRKTTNKPPLGSRSSGRDLNTGPPEYDAGMLTTRPRRSVDWNTSLLQQIEIMKQFCCVESKV